MTSENDKSCVAAAPNSRKLDELLAGIDGIIADEGSAEGVVVSSVTADSQSVCEGALFVAVKGATHDGHAYITDAVARGAVAVVVETLTENDKASVAGAALFVFSDFTLAYNRFVKPFRSARFLNLTTYFAAQWCLAFSVRLFGA